MSANTLPFCACPCRTEKRERRREAKAEVAARLDKAIEAELLKRLQAGTYGDIYNFPLKQYEKVRAWEEQQLQQDCLRLKLWLMEGLPSEEVKQ